VVSENQRVRDFAAAFAADDLETAGALMLDSHRSLADDFAVSTPELDLLVRLLHEHGAYGARLTGAGFGGCCLALTPRGAGVDIAERTARDYATETRRDPMVIPVRAVGGASVIDSSP
jgi:galactokinase